MKDDPLFSKSLDDLLPSSRTENRRNDDPVSKSRQPFRRNITRWWQFGLFGGIILCGMTCIRIIRAIVRGAVEESEWTEAAGIAAAMFGMGFACGLVVWAGRGMYRRIGMAGDALVGAVVMVVFFLSCMLLFEPELLGRKFENGGAPMLGGAVLLGCLGGAWTGRDLRKEMARSK